MCSIAQQSMDTDQAETQLASSRGKEEIRRRLRRQRKRWRKITHTESYFQRSKLYTQTALQKQESIINHLQSNLQPSIYLREHHTSFIDSKKPEDELTLIKGRGINRRRERRDDWALKLQETPIIETGITPVKNRHPHQRSVLRRQSRTSIAKGEGKNAGSKTGRAPKDKYISGNRKPVEKIRNRLIEAGNKPAI